MSPGEIAMLKFVLRPFLLCLHGAQGDGARLAELVQALDLSDFERLREAEEMCANPGDGYLDVSPNWWGAVGVRLGSRDDSEDGLAWVGLGLAALDKLASITHAMSIEVSRHSLRVALNPRMSSRLCDPNEIRAVLEALREGSGVP